MDPVVIKNVPQPHTKNPNLSYNSELNIRNNDTVCVALSIVMINKNVLCIIPRKQFYSPPIIRTIPSPSNISETHRVSFPHNSPHVRQVTRYQINFVTSSFLLFLATVTKCTGLSTAQLAFISMFSTDDTAIAMFDSNFYYMSQIYRRMVICRSISAETK